MTTREAAEKWGVSVARVQDYLLCGRIPGAYQGVAGGKWHLPDDAEKPDRAEYGTVARAMAAKKPKPTAKPLVKPGEPPLSMAEKEEHVKRYAHTKCYGDLCVELGCTRVEVREIYDRLHARYGI